MEPWISCGNRTSGYGPPGWAFEALTASRWKKPRHRRTDADRRSRPCYLSHVTRWRGIANACEADDEPWIKSDDGNRILGLNENLTERKVFTLPRFRSHASVPLFFPALSRLSNISPQKE